MTKDPDGPHFDIRHQAATPDNLAQTQTLTDEGTLVLKTRFSNTANMPDHQHRSHTETPISPETEEVQAESTEEIVVV